MDQLSKGVKVVEYISYRTYRMVDGLGNAAYWVGHKFPPVRWWLEFRERFDK